MPLPASFLQWRTPAGFEWTRLSLPVRGLPPALRGLRIIHLSDTHFRARWWPAYDRVIDSINDAQADLILFTGDFIEFRARRERAIPHIARFFTALQARLGVWAVLGNHDRGYDLAADRAERANAFPRSRDLPPPDGGSASSRAHSLGRYLADWGVNWLNQQSAHIPIGDAAIELIGLPGTHPSQLDQTWVRSLPGPQAQVPRIVMCHYPDLIRPAAPLLRPSLYLCGHTHGGQICLPGGMPIIRHSRLPRSQCRGLHRWKVDDDPSHDCWLVVNRGLGFSGLPLRLFCPAQIIEITLDFE